jgi:hypothetical protein
MWLVLVQTGRSCPNAHSRLILSLPSAGWTVYRRLHFFPTGAVWLGCLSLGAWLTEFGCLAWDFLFHICTHAATNKLSHIQLDRWHTCTFKINHDHINGEDRTDLLLTTPSVRNKKAAKHVEHKFEFQ